MRRCCSDGIALIPVESATSPPRANRTAMRNTGNSFTRSHDTNTRPSRVLSTRLKDGYVLTYPTSIGSPRRSGRPSSSTQGDNDMLTTQRRATATMSKSHITPGYILPSSHTHTHVSHTHVAHHPPESQGYKKSLTEIESLHMLSVSGFTRKSIRPSGFES